MPKNNASIRVVSHTPDHGDGSIKMGDTVTFEISPPDAGVISAYGARDGNIVVAWNNFRGDLDIELTPSQSYLQNPGPLHVDVQLRELVGHNVKTVAETSFEVTE